MKIKSGQGQTVHLRAKHLANKKRERASKSAKNNQKNRQIYYNQSNRKTYKQTIDQKKSESAIL